MLIGKAGVITSLVLLTFGASAKTCTWTGEGLDRKWSTPQNWGGQSAADVPASGDTVVVNLGSVSANTNDIAGLTLAGLTLTGPTSAATIFAGEKIKLAPNGMATINTTKTGSYVYVPFDLPETATLTVNNGEAVVLSGALSGSGIFRKLGGGKLQIDARSTAFAGTWNLENGQIMIYANADAFGGGVVNVYGKANASGSGAKLYFLRPITVANDFSLSYDTEIRSQRGVTLTGDVVVKTANSTETCLVVTESSGSNHGYVVFSGDFSVDATEHAGKLTVSMENANHYVRFAGSLNLVDRRLGFGNSAEGTVYLDCSVSSTYSGNDFLQLDNGVKVVMGRRNALPETAKITFGTATVAGGLRGGLDLNGHDQRVAMIYADPSTATATNRQYLTSSGGPARLTVVAGTTTSNCIYSDFLQGAASLELFATAVWKPKFFGDNPSSGSLVAHSNLKPELWGVYPNIRTLEISGVSQVFSHGATINAAVELVLDELSTTGSTIGGLVPYDAPEGADGATISVACVLQNGVDIPAGSYTKAKASWVRAGTCVISDHVYRWIWTGSAGDGQVATAANWATNVAPGEAAAPVVLDFSRAVPSQTVTIPTALTVAGLTSGTNTSPICLKGPGALTVSGASPNAICATLQDDLSIVHSGTGTQTFSCPAASALRALSVVSGRVSFGDGCLVGEVGTVSVGNGAILELGEGVTPVCRELVLAGVSQSGGKYGSSVSPARHKTDASFAGPGFLWCRKGMVLVFR